MVAAGAQPDAPKLARTPLELLSLREGEGYNAFDRYAVPVLGGLLGFFIPILPNKLNYRPPWAGIWQHFAFAAIGYFGSDLYVQVRMKQRAEDVAVMKHYISLHPEDFPPYERMQIKYMYMPWKPFR